MSEYELQRILAELEARHSALAREHSVLVERVVALKERLDRLEGVRDATPPEMPLEFHEPVPDLSGLDRPTERIAKTRVDSPRGESPYGC